MNEIAGGQILKGLHRPLRAFRPAIALTVTRAARDRTEILVGVRDPAANRYHQNVASVPTRWVQPTVGRIWARQLRLGRSIHERADLRDEVNTLLSRKLGVADALERGELSFTVAAVTAIQGVSIIGDAATERITMFNARIAITAGDELFPSQTASYRPIVWAGVNDFLTMVRTRDVGQLGVGLENSFFCAYGLCLQTSASNLA